MIGGGGQRFDGLRVAALTEGPGRLLADARTIRRPAARRAGATVRSSPLRPSAQAARSRTGAASSSSAASSGAMTRRSPFRPSAQAACSRTHGSTSDNAVMSGSIAEAVADQAEAPRRLGARGRVGMTRAPPARRSGTHQPRWIRASAAGHAGPAARPRARGRGPARRRDTARPCPHSTDRSARKVCSVRVVLSFTPPGGYVDETGVAGVDCVRSGRSPCGPRDRPGPTHFSALAVRAAAARDVRGGVVRGACGCALGDRRIIRRAPDHPAQHSPADAPAARSRPAGPDLHQRLAHPHADRRARPRRRARAPPYARRAASGAGRARDQREALPRAHRAQLGRGRAVQRRRPCPVREPGDDARAGL